MANEGFLGKFSFGGERAATNDHPGVLLHLPLDESVKTAIPVGTLMKGIDVLAARAVTGASNSGVTSAKVNVDTLKGKVSGAIGTYAFSYDGSDWKLSGETATLSEYGVTPEGSPQNGDTITVTLYVEDVLYAPYLSTDERAEPRAIVDAPCDPTGEHGEKSALCIVHGTAKSRLLKTGDGKSVGPAEIAALAARGIFAV